jgi:4-diphosphocytidyl-2-C-methyl-D-erythritol kinase
VIIRSHAKINWSLRITGKRDDGFHAIETLFQQISLRDVVTIEEAAEFSLTCSDPAIPTDESNLALRAARAIGSPPVAIHIEKNIPAGGGLGGGSSNAAATLVALDEMFDLRAPLSEIALQLGSDVPFFLIGGTAYATGRGEELTPMTGPPPTPLLVLLPEERVLTREAFAMLRRFSTPLGIDRYRAMDPSDWSNDFEEPIFEQLPHLGELKSRLLEAGATWAGMTGSGSTIVGAFRDASARDEAAARFQDVRCEPAVTT